MARSRTAVGMCSKASPQANSPKVRAGTDGAGKLSSMGFSTLVSTVWVDRHLQGKGMCECPDVHTHMHIPLLCYSEVSRTEVSRWRGPTLSITDRVTRGVRGTNDGVTLNWTAP